MFEGFQEDYIDGEGARVFVRRAGPHGAPPLLLMHGYPQTSAMWHKVAPALAENFQVVCPDLRGYGRSSKPLSDPEHLAYSKREMAKDMMAVMQSLGHEQFYIGAHDRGARVAHRLGLDYPDAVPAMALLDIAPTREMYANTTPEFAAAYWHWFLLIQKAPLPETLIAGDPEAFWKLKCFAQAGNKNPFAGDALAEYLQAFADPAVIHATCEDYRAAYSIDISHDDEDGGQKLVMPILVLWGGHGAVGKCFDTLDLWRQRAVRADGESLPGGHYLAEELPDKIIARFEAFFSRHL